MRSYEAIVCCWVPDFTALATTQLSAEGHQPMEHPRGRRREEMGASIGPNITKARMHI
jgi:hypothetical protein